VENENYLIQFSNDMANAVEKAAKYTVMVDGRSRMPASGILIKSNFVITADHVLEGNENVKIGLDDVNVVTADVVGRDPSTDLALLKLNENAPEFADLVELEPKVGQFVLAIGRPSTGGVQASLGVISAVGIGRLHSSVASGHRRKSHAGHFGGRFSEAPLIRTDAIPYPGFSGGPLINAEGKVVGMNTSGLARGISIAIPSVFVWKVGESLEQHGSVKKGYLGIRSQPVHLPDKLQNHYAQDQKTGLLIVWIEQDSPADRGGLLVGDILVSVDGNPVQGAEDLQASLYGDVAGKPTRLKIVRGGKITELVVTPGERS